MRQHALSARRRRRFSDTRTSAVSHGTLANIYFFLDFSTLVRTFHSAILFVIPDASAIDVGEARQNGII
jgi:hypothetical protein